MMYNSLITIKRIFAAEVYTSCFLPFVSQLSGEQCAALLFCEIVFPSRDGLQQFWTWLESLRGEGEGRNLLVTAHNGSAFDFPILMVIFSSHTFLFVLCMTPGQHDQPWGQHSSQPFYASTVCRHLQSLQVRDNFFHFRSTNVSGSFVRKLFSEQGEGGQSCKLETLLQKYHPLWRETQVNSD